MMIPLPSIQSVDEILEEQEASRRAETSQIAQNAGENHYRDRTITGAAASRATTRSVRVGPPGKTLSRHCTLQSRKTLDNILWMEDLIEDPRDHNPLVIFGSLVLERELKHKIGDPARRLGCVLLEAGGERLTPKQTAAFERWLDGKLPTTLGTVELVLFALSQGLAQGVPEVLHLLERRFDQEYARLLKEGGLLQCLSSVRTRYRNPAAHGLRTFQSSEYGDFCRLIVGCGRFQEWYGSGPVTAKPEAGTALLHHQLAHLKRKGTRDDLAEEAKPPPRSHASLLSLRTPAASDLRVTCEVTNPRTRRGSKGSARLEIGDPMRIVVEVEQDCHVCLVYFPFGKPASLLFPNRLMPESRVTANMGLVLPDHLPHALAMTADGPPGKESMLLLASREPLEIGVIGAKPGGLFRDLPEPALATLAASVGSLPAEVWAVARHELEIRAAECES